MLNVYIYEKSEGNLDSLKNAIEELGIPITCCTYESYNFRREIKNSFLKGIYFIDSGLNRHRLEDCMDYMKEFKLVKFMVFVLIESDRYLLTMECGYKVLGCILRSDDLKEKIPKLLELAEKNIEHEKETWKSTYVPQSWSGIDFEDIIIFKANEKSRIILYAVDRVVDFHGDLSKIEKVLDSRFVRIDKLTIINKDRLPGLNKKKLSWRLLRLKNII